ncbi:MAG: hypothetical protein GY801_39260 [bacterium]|nr:hypothetical protein [bacterium]
MHAARFSVKFHIFVQNENFEIAFPVSEKAFGIQCEAFAGSPRISHSENLTELSMPCFTNHSLGTKLVSLVPENPQKGLPAFFGVVVWRSGDSIHIPQVRHMLKHVANMTKSVETD